MLKIVDKETVYIPLKELSASQIAAMSDAGVLNIVTFSSVGDVVRESDFNLMLQANEEQLQKNGGHIELTKADELSVRLKENASLNPLKYMFLTGFGQSESEALKQIAEEEKEETRREIAKIRDMTSKRMKKYSEVLETIQKSEAVITKSLAPLGLELQFVTELHRESGAGLMCFLSGKNVFYEIFLDAMEEDCWSSFRGIENGFAFYDLYEEDEQYAIIEDIGRDFRKYTPLENIRWCLMNLNLNNDFKDEVSCEIGGVYVSCGINMAMKCFNRRSFGDSIFINGICGIQEKIIGTEARGEEECR